LREKLIASRRIQNARLAKLRGENLESVNSRNALVSSPGAPEFGFLKQDEAADNFTADGVAGNVTASFEEAVAENHADEHLLLESTLLLDSGDEAVSYAADVAEIVRASAIAGNDDRPSLINDAIAKFFDANRQLEEARSSEV
jgi:hypothetical protein